MPEDAFSKDDLGCIGSVQAIDTVGRQTPFCRAIASRSGELDRVQQLGSIGRGCYSQIILAYGSTALGQNGRTLKLGGSRNVLDVADDARVFLQLSVSYIHDHQQGLTLCILVTRPIFDRAACFPLGEAGSDSRRRGASLLEAHATGNKHIRGGEPSNMTDVL